MNLRRIEAESIRDKISFAGITNSRPSKLHNTRSARQLVPDIRVGE